jgi:hypothetical protein
MTTIDKLDLSVYNLYALRTTMVEQIQSQLRLDLDSSIPPQTHVLNIYPKMTEMEMLLGVTPMNPPWAFFGPPPKLRKRVVRRSPFAFWRVAPALGSYSEQEEDEERLINYVCEDEEEKEEKEAILGCLKQVTKINGWLGHIVGRLGQFLQG